MAKNDTTRNNTKNSSKSDKSPTSASPGNQKVAPAKTVEELELKSASPTSEVIVKKGLDGFFSDVQLELSKVAWPSRQQLISESIAVLLMVIVAAVLVYLVDSLFGWAASQVFQ